MCGIGFALCLGKCNELPSGGCSHHVLDESTLNLMRRRGPDQWNTVSLLVPVGTGLSVNVHLWAAVLSLRGNESSEQPVKGPGGILCFNGEIYSGLYVPPEMSDTAVLIESLSSSSSPSAVAQLVSSLRGPWAFVYVCQKSRKIYFGRDIFGRRSLLIRRTTCGFQLTSVAHEHQLGENRWEELPAQGVYIYDMLVSSWTLMQWDRTPSGSTIHNVSSCAALHDVPLATEHLTSPIEVALQRTPSTRLVSIQGSAVDVFGVLLDVYEKEVAAFHDALHKAIKRRVENISKRFTDIPVGILFSGGIDSTVIAAIALRSFPDVAFELINVAFEHRDSQGQPSFNTPDRRTSIEAFKELEALDGVEISKARLLCVDVSYVELQRARAGLHVSRLIHPMNTVLDDSLGFALWFAARGHGYDYKTTKRYENRSKVLLLGMGADEQLGGYSHHAASFKDCSWSSLGNCIAMDMDRISCRNLGRDDRVLADLGKESRAPFLDEDLVSFLNGLPLDAKMGLNQPRNVGDKLILRLLAYKINLRETAQRAKKALQFGSKIAHVDPKRNKGHIICNRFEKH
ncbi:asparagine synthetase domain-containing protein 1-like [Tropilaelaps mercedesae]|uniref:Asparagine synthetase domain-containing protein 1-like n=1 Tax=Tropilaelaps mercedesae TaxID=418985 RepID=A0A1V9Y3Q4_9ACAR|nr:asparagine synthetase domain-containing protein 1-like [Tropilaelaps mercedesae]